MKKLLFQQRFFSWLDSYDVYDNQENLVYQVEGKLSWGHCLHILDHTGIHIGTVKERALVFLPRMELFIQDEYVGSVQKKFAFFRPRYELDFLGWSVQGDIWAWNYQVCDAKGRTIAAIQKQLGWTDTYELTVFDDRDALIVLMIIIAIDVAQCSQGNR